MIALDTGSRSAKGTPRSPPSHEVQLMVMKIQATKHVISFNVHVDSLYNAEQNTNMEEDHYGVHGPTISLSREPNFLT